MENTNSAIVKRLRNKFEDLYLNFDDFVDLLKTHKAILSGSFLLQTIKNCEYSGFDLDIYVLGERQNTTFEMQLNALYNSALSKMIIKHLDKSKKLAKNAHFIHDEKKALKMPPNLGIASVVRMMKTGYNGHVHIKGVSAITKSDDDNVWGHCADLTNTLSYIQIVYIDPKKYDKLEDFIIESVDFDFCRNYFDGDTVFMQKPESIFAPDYIHKISTIHELYYKSHRIDKYNKRGYHIKVSYNDELYHLIILNDSYKEEFIKLNEEIVDNLMIVNFNSSLSKNYFLEKEKELILSYIPNSVNKCVIYGYDFNINLNNIPSSLSILNSYVFTKYGEKPAHTFKTGKILYYAKMMNIAISRPKNASCDKKILNTKIPFGCKIFLNEELLN